jgi:hypothetical protein
LGAISASSGTFLARISEFEGFFSHFLAQFYVFPNSQFLSVLLLVINEHPVHLKALAWSILGRKGYNSPSRWRKRRRRVGIADGLAPPPGRHRWQVVGC